MEIVEVTFVDVLVRYEESFVVVSTSVYYGIAWAFVISMRLGWFHG